MTYTRRTILGMGGGVLISPVAGCIDDSGEEEETTETGETMETDDEEEPVFSEQDGNNASQNNEEQDNEEQDTDNADDADGEEQTYTLTVRVEEDVPIIIERQSDGTTTERNAVRGTAEFEVEEGIYNISPDGHEEVEQEVTDEDITVELERIYVLTIDVQNDVPVVIEQLSTGATIERDPTDGTIEIETYSGIFGISAEGHHPQEVEVNNDVSIELEATNILTVEVMDDDSREPVPYATVHVDAIGDDIDDLVETEHEAETDDAGVVEFEVPESMSYIVTTSADGYDQDTFETGLDREFIVELVPEEVPEAGTTIFVTDHDRNNIEGATVSVGDVDTGQTNENGHIQFDIPVDDTVHEVSVSAPGYESGHTTIEAGESEFVRLSPKSNDENTDGNDDNNQSLLATVV